MRKKFSLIAIDAVNIPTCYITKLLFLFFKQQAQCRFNDSSKGPAKKVICSYTGLLYSVFFLFCSAHRDNLIERFFCHYFTIQDCFISSHSIHTASYQENITSFAAGLAAGTHSY